jgi:hypothetical protein
MRNAKRYSWRVLWRLFQQMLAGTAIVSKASAAAIVPLAAPKDSEVWTQVRREVEAEQKQGDLSVEVSNALGQALRGADRIDGVVRWSYLTIPNEHWAALDRFWMSRAEILTSPANYRTYVDVRRALAGTASGFSADITHEWIQKAHHRPGHYDNGGGND